MTFDLGKTIHFNPKQVKFVDQDFSSAKSEG